MSTLLSMLLSAVFCLAYSVSVEPCIGQDANASGFIFKSLTRTPATRAVPGQVAVLVATVANQSHSSNSIRLSAKVSGFPDRAFVRDINIAPKAERQVYLYVRIPTETKGTARLEVVVEALRKVSENRYVQLEANGNPISQSLPLSVEEVMAYPGMVIDSGPAWAPFWHWPLPEPHYQYEHIKGTCVDTNLSIRTANFDVYPIPISQLVLDTIDWIVIAEPYSLQDGAVTEALKRFVSSGGALWIMLDRVPTDQIRPFLQGEQLCETIDETELTDFVIDVLRDTTSFAEVDRTINLDRPCKFKRVALNGATITHKVGEWPVAFHFECGYGRIFFTTLDSSAWIEPRKIQKSVDPQFQSAFQNRMWAINWARAVSTDRTDLPLSTMEPAYAIEFIGTPVPPRSTIFGSLAIFCLLILGLGIWRIVSGDLRQIGYLIPIAALLVSGFLIVVSSLVRRDIPETVARLQVVDVTSSGSSAQVREFGAVYLRAASDMTLLGEMDGLAIHDSTVLSGIKQYQTIDANHWRFGNETWPPGIWKYTTRGSIETQSLQVDAELTQNGLNLSTPASLSLEDPIVQFANGSKILCEKTEGGWEADGELSARGDRWFTSSLVSNEQARRARVYMELFSNREREMRPNRRFYGWSPLWDKLPKWSQPLNYSGSALVSLPIHLKRPAVNQRILIPNGLISLRFDRASSSATAAYSEAKGEWISESPSTLDAKLEFALPDEVLPFQAEEITFEIDVKAPKRTVTLSIINDDKTREIVKLNSPSVPWKGLITDPSVLADCRDGIIRINLSISARMDNENADFSSAIVNWRISHLQMSARGRVVADSNFSSKQETAR